MNDQIIQIINSLRKFYSECFYHSTLPIACIITIIYNQFEDTNLVTYPIVYDGKGIEGVHYNTVTMKNEAIRRKC